MCEEMKTLVSRFAEYLRRSEQQLRSFHKYESQVEGWFKGELICFLDREKIEGRLPNFEREKTLYVHVGDKRKRMQIDFVLHFDETDRSHDSWVELKHWIGYQNNQQFIPSQYFTIPRKRSDSCAYCVERLLTIPGNDDKFILVPFTPNPCPEDWRAGVELFNTNFAPLSVRSLTNPSDYPDFFFLGLLHVPEGEDVAKDLDKSE